MAVATGATRAMDGPGSDGPAGTECCVACGHATIVADAACRRCAECGAGWPPETILVRVRRPSGPTDRRRPAHRLAVVLVLVVVVGGAVADPRLALGLVAPAVIIGLALHGWRSSRIVRGYAITPTGIEAWWSGGRRRTLAYRELTSFRLHHRPGRRPLLLLGHPRGLGFDRAELVADDAVIARIQARLARELPELLAWSPA